VSFVMAAPEVMTDAATDLASLGSTISAAHAAAAARTSGVPAAGADEVSAAITTLFSEHASAYQALGAQVPSRTANPGIIWSRTTTPIRQP
jgi:triacylglycerol lipase